MTCSGEHKKEDTTKNIETDSVTIWLPGPGPVIQCSNVDTVSLPRPAPAPAPAWTVRAGPWQTSVN